MLLERKPATETSDSHYKGVTFCREHFHWARSEDAAELEVASLSVNYVELSEVQKLMQSLLPNAICKTDLEHQTLIVVGSRATIEQAKELLYEIDKSSADQP